MFRGVARDKFVVIVSKVAVLVCKELRKTVIRALNSTTVLIIIRHENIQLYLFLLEHMRSAAFSFLFLLKNIKKKQHVNSL